MDIVEQIFKTLNPPKEEMAEQRETGEYITKEELENVVTKVTENIESKFSAMIDKLVQPKPTDDKEGSTQKSVVAENGDEPKGENL